MAVRRRIRILTLALVGALAACQTQPEAAPPVPTPSTETDAQASAAPTAAPSPEASETPLPEPTVDSDLATDDQAAIETLLESDALQAYLPADLINDGGVILYQTLALGDRAQRTGAVRTEGDAAPTPPEAWKRLDVEQGGRQLVLRKLSGPDDKRANVVVRYPMRGVLAYRDPQRGTPVRKRFHQVFERVFRFKLKDSQWKLAELSPIHMETQGGRSGLELRSFEVYEEGAATPAITLTDRDRLITPGEVPALASGTKVRLEVRVDSLRDHPVFVYAHLNGKADRSRRPLVDDGTQGDTTAGDGIYSSVFVVPTQTGLHHFGVDILDAASFQPGGLVRWNALGLSFKVEE